MAKKLEYKIKVYGKGATIYPTEVYELKSKSKAKKYFDVMKNLDPYIRCQIDVIEYVYIDGELKEHNYLFEKP